ncbi:MFS transporter [Paenibacillus radicis (ex Xue et al. 2023)]|uniref:MFS transporter n=1 Tax=Paenibacillus radicis (ex Xue et al. 2023) TaxID=2972489 RepID=A0ABT1YCD5_9BACL|nr:MFS transporter [Paenibacillus radicis (ex Xue et al. 2023)]MCR8630074.1 MFS transporter [Paenibacillus radicis (ex Xue et al. 2023)]
MKSDSKQHKGPILMRLMMFTVMMSSMSSLMFNIVLPQIGEEFHLTLAQVSWLSSAYTLIYAFGTVTYGKLADRFQLKSLLTFGLTLFAAGSLIGLVSQTFWLALLGRCLQSAGAAAIPAIALIIPVQYFSPEKRGSALSMSAVGIALGSALAPVISAIVVSFANWRWLFLPSLLILLLLPLFRKYLEHEPKEAPRTFDWLGGSLLAASITLLLLGVTNLTWSYLVFGLVSLILFIVRICTTKDAFIEPQLFRNKKYASGLALAFLIAGIGISLYLLTPILFSEVYRLGSNWIGFAMVPAAIASAILGRKGGKLADLKGNSYLISVASGSLISCFALLSIFTGISPLWISFFLIFGNVGQSFLQIAMSNFISKSLPKDQVGVGMGLFSMISFISQGIAAGVYGIVAAHGSSVSWNPLNVDPGGYVFSNIYLVLAAMHVGILLFYRVQFRTKNPSVSIER